MGAVARKRKKARGIAGALDSRRSIGTMIAVMTLGVMVLGIGLGGLWYYTTKSYMVMAGEPEMTVGLNGLFEDPGVEARISGRDVTDKVDIASKLDTGRPGTYDITYSAGNFSETRKVTVLDHMSPELQLEGGEVTMRLGEKFEEPGYTARSEDGEDLTSKVKVTGIGENRAGIKRVNYTVTDSEGRATRLSRKLTIEENTEYESPGLPICMYHYVYDENDPPDNVNNRYGNYISLQSLQEEVDWLKSEDYYFPTWKEVRDYVQGKLLLPEKSIVLTFDDGEKATLKLLEPFARENQVPVTSFLITSKKGEEKVRKYRNDYLIFESHTHDLHRGGGVPGHRGIFPVISEEEGLADLEISADICDSGEAFAYPYGDYSESAKAILEKAGYLCAVTTQPGKVYPGDDPLLLNRQRMSQGQSLATFQSKVAPPEKTEDTHGSLR